MSPPVQPSQQVVSPPVQSQAHTPPTSVSAAPEPQNPSKLDAALDTAAGCGSVVARIYGGVIVVASIAGAFGTGAWGIALVALYGIYLLLGGRFVIY
jgi:hypothetical protein